MRKSDTPDTLPRAMQRKRRSPMELIRPPRPASVKANTLAPMSAEFTIMLGTRDAKGNLSDKPTASQQASGIMLRFPYAENGEVHETKAARNPNPARFKYACLMLHTLGTVQVLSDYRTGYRLCEVDYSLGYKLRGENPTELEAARDSFQAFLLKHGAERFEKALAKLPTVNK